MANFSDTVVYLVVHSPVGPINDVKNEEGEGEHVHENAIHSSQPLSLVDGRNLFFPFVQLRPLVQEAVFRVNHSQAFPLFHQLQLFLDLKTSIVSHANASIECHSMTKPTCPRNDTRRPKGHFSHKKGHTESYNIAEKLRIAVSVYKVLLGVQKSLVFKEGYETSKPYEAAFLEITA